MAHSQRDEISGLIKAVKEHRKFKQLACYSIQALDKSIDPSKSKTRWRENVALAIELDAAAVVCDILKRHPGNETVLLVCTECLQKLAIDGTNAVVIAEENAVPYLLNSIKANPELPEEVLHLSVSLLDMLCSHAKVSELVLNEETLAEVMGVLDSATDPLVLASCIHVVEKMTKNSDSAMNETCLPHILKALETLAKSDVIDEQSEECVLSSTRIFQRLLKGGSGVEARLREIGGINTYLSVLEAFKESQKVNRSVGKVISKLMGGNVSELVSTLETKGLSPEAQERTMALISSMAVDASSVDELMRGNGVASIIGSMESKMSQRALEETAKTIARLASSPKNIQKLLDNGALDQIMKVLNEDLASLEMKSSMILALNRIITARPDTAERIADSGTLQRMVKALHSDGDNAALAKNVFEILKRVPPATLSTVDSSMLLEATLKSIESCTHDVSLQLLGLSALNSLTRVAPDEAKGAITEAALPLALELMSNYQSSPTILTEGLNLLAAMSSSPECLKQMQSAKAFDVVVDTVGSNMDNLEIRAAASHLIVELASDELIQSFCQSLGEFSTAFQAGKASQAEIAAIPKLALSLGTIATVSTNVSKIQQCGGVAPMMTLMGAVAQMPTCPNQEELLVTFASALGEIVSQESSWAAVESMQSTDAITQAISVLQSQSVSASVSAASLKLLEQALGGNIASLEQKMTSEVLDTVATQLRLYPANLEVTSHGLSIFQTMIDGSDGNETVMAKEVVQRSGRQIINVMDGIQALNSEDSEELKVANVVAAVSIFERCAQTTEGRLMAGKLGAVKAVLDTLEAQSASLEIVSSCSHALTTLVTDSDVTRVTDRVTTRLAELKASGGSDQLLAQLSEDVTKLGLLMMCDDFAAGLEQSGGAQLVVDVTATVDQTVTDSKLKDELLKRCVQAFGHAVDSKLTVERAVGVVPALTRILAVDPTVETLRAVAALAKGDPSVLSALIDHGAVDTLVPMLDDMADVTQRAAAFHTMAALASTPQGSARVVASGGAQFVLDQLRDDMDSSANRENVCSALEFVSQIGGAGGYSKLIDGGLLEIIEETLSEEETDLSVVTSVNHLLSAMMMEDTSSKRVMEAGLPQHINAILQTTDLLADVGCAMATTELFANLSKAGYSKELEELKAADTLLSAMDQHATNTELSQQFAHTIGVIRMQADPSKSSKEYLTETLDSAQTALLAVKGGQASHGTLLEQLQLAANLIMVDEAVDQSCVDRLNNMVTDVMAMLPSMQASAEKEAITAVALKLLGRLAALDSVEVNVDDALTTTTQFLNNDSDVIVASAVSCIGGIAASRRGVQSIARHGTVAHVQRRVHQKARVGPITTGGGSEYSVASVASATMDVMRRQAMSNAALLVQEEGGAEAIAAILCSVTDDRVLASTLDQILELPEGNQALLETLAQMKPPDFGGNKRTAEFIVKSLLNQRDDSGPSLKVESPAHIATIVACSQLNPSLEPALVLLEMAFQTPEGCLILSRTDGCVTALLDGLTSTNIAVRAASIAALARMASHNDEMINGTLIQVKAAEAVLSAVSKHRSAPLGDAYLRSALYSLNALLNTVGVENCAVEKDSIRIVQDIAVSHAEDEYIVSQCQQIMLVLADAFAGGSEALLEERLAVFSNPISAWQAVRSPDGRVYYFHAETGETTWEEPAEHRELMQTLAAVKELVTSLDDSLTNIDPKVFLPLVGMLGAFARDGAVCPQVAHVLAAASRGRATSQMLGDQPGAGDIVAAMQYNLELESFVEDVSELLCNLSEYPTFRDALTSVEYISVLNQTCLTHIKNKLIVRRCIITLANVVFHHPETIVHCLEVDAPLTVSKAMQAHKLSEEVAEASLLLIGNLLTDDDDVKVRICRVINAPLVDSLRRFSGNEEYFTTAVRSMGNMSLVDDCIELMVRAHATRWIVQGMEQHKQSQGQLSCAIELLSNFGAIEDEDLDEAMTQFIVDEGGIQAILRVMAQYDTEVPLLIVAYEALYNIGNDETAADVLVEEGVVKQVFQTIQNFDYEKLLVDQAMKFLSVLTYNDEAVVAIGDNNCLPIIFQAVKTRISNTEFVLDAVHTVSNCVPDPRNRAAVANHGLLLDLFELMQAYEADAEVVKFVIITCIRLSADDAISQRLAQEGMSQFMRCTSSLGMTDVELLSLLFELLGQLAFVKENLKIIVQHGGIRVLLLVMGVEEYQQEAALMTKAIGMLDNVVSSDEEFASAVADRGGRDLIVQLDTLHQDDEELRQAAASALLSLDAMRKTKEHQGSKTHRAALFARLGRDAVNLHGDKNKAVEKDSSHEEPEEDPLIDYRSLLQSGVSVKSYAKGVPSNQWLFVAAEWNAVMLKDNSKKIKKGERYLIRSLDKVLKGLGTGHEKKGVIGSGSKVDEDCSLYVMNRPRAGETAFHLLSLTFKSTDERDLWFNALSRLIQTSKLWNHRLKSG